MASDTLTVSQLALTYLEARVRIVHSAINIYIVHNHILTTAKKTVGM